MSRKKNRKPIKEIQEALNEDYSKELDKLREYTEEDDALVDTILNAREARLRGILQIPISSTNESK